MLHVDLHVYRFRSWELYPYALHPPLCPPSPVQEVGALRRQLAQRDEEVQEQQQQLRELRQQLEQVLQEQGTEPQLSQGPRAPSRQTTLPPQAKVGITDDRYYMKWK